jgi:hypothetical protein
LGKDGQTSNTKVCLRYAEKEKVTEMTVLELTAANVRELVDESGCSEEEWLADGENGTCRQLFVFRFRPKRDSIQIGARSNGYKDPAMTLSEKNIWVAAGDGDLVRWLFYWRKLISFITRTVYG